MNRDPYKYFRVEAGEIVESLSRGVLELGRGTTRKDLVPHLLRLAHTLKGAAHVVKQPAIAGLAHNLEDALLPLADAPPSAGLDATTMLGLVDAIASQLQQLGHEESAPAQHPAPTATEEPFETLRIDIAEMDAVLEGVSEVSVQIAALKTRLQGLEDSANLVSLLIDQLAPRPGPNGDRRAAIAKSRAIAQELHSHLQSLDRGGASAIDQIRRELIQVRDVASQLRLVPASAVFAALERAARNAAQALGKQIEFEAVGGEHRLDAHVLIAVRDALLHVVRNAVSHAIESPAQRAVLGKPPAGRVTLRVEHRGNRVAFACHDDGRGFDTDALREAAVARGLLAPAEAASLGTDEILRLILRGRLTTTAAADELSGRGLGLDVVRETVARLKGDLNVETESGVGSTIEICVPVSLLSVEAVIVESNGMTAAIPLDAVQQGLHLSEKDIVHQAERESVVIEGTTMRFLPLARALRQAAPARAAKSNLLGAPGQPNSRLSSVLVVRSQGELAAIGVDRLLGTGTVVLRPIPPYAGVDPVVAGASLDGQGNPQLVLDPAGLLAAAHGLQATSGPAAAKAAPVVLVIDDSLTSRMLQQSILESAGYEVEVAGSGEEALDKARGRHYDLFIVDVEMPGMDGFDFVAQTQAELALREIPSILVTSRTADEDRQRGVEVGARYYMVKSEFDQAELLRTIRQLLS